MNLNTGRVLNGTPLDHRQARIIFARLQGRRQEFCSAGAPAPETPYTALMFARKLRVEITVGGQQQPCPIDWLDNFCMRNFTGQAEFDDTLPVSDGLIEAGSRVHPGRLAEAMGDWFTRRGKGNGNPVHVRIDPA
jgi:hypothetical protein